MKQTWSIGDVLRLNAETHDANIIVTLILKNNQQSFLLKVFPI